MNRRLVLQGLGTMVLLFAMGVAGAAETRPNILLYVVDDQGSTDAGCYGNPVIKTPGLDMLAAAGTRYTSAFCTTASCSASRSVILTGLHNHATGQYGHEHSYHHFVSFPTLKSLPVLLEEAGYRTASAGKYHVAPQEVYHFQARIGGKNAPQLAENCRKFLEREDERPFFLYCCTSEPHRPFKRATADPVKPEDVIVPDYLPDTPECREELAEYYSSVQQADSGLLKLIEMLKENGQWDNTVILYVSDNGIAFPGAKTTLYEPGMKLPCVVRDPKQEQTGVVNDAMISWADITPTLLEYADALPEGYEYQGKSFRKTVGNDNPEGWDEVYASHTFHEITMYYPMRVLRERKYKLIWNIAYKMDYPFASDLLASKTWQGLLKDKATHLGKREIDAYLHRPMLELYDLEADPHEVNNLAEDPEYAGVRWRMLAKLKRFQEETHDPWITVWGYDGYHPE